MKQAFDNTAREAIGLGLIAGTRATLATTIAAHFLSRRPTASLAHSKLNFIQRPSVSIITKILSAAEIAGDKLPNIPDRTTPPALIARVASGGFAGALVANANS